MAKTLFEKIWDRHIVRTIDGGPSVLYIDKHLIHEVTSPQAFKGIENRGLEVFRPRQIVATADHNVPTIHRELPIKEELSRIQVQKLVENCKRHHVRTIRPWSSLPGHCSCYRARARPHTARHDHRLR
ncbi:aconitase family protein [Puia sp. P3]|uniref:aconitase family protein n=1 Tax=Puia sp. P3 TaxID=3423952 RepID=UPI003D66EBCD